MATQFPGPSWRDLKKELLNKWQELTEHELENTRGNAQSIVDLIEKKVGLAFEEASHKFQEMASHYRLYDEPDEKESPEELHREKKERVLELSPKKPRGRDVKPRDPFHPL